MPRNRSIRFYENIYRFFQFVIKLFQYKNINNKTKSHVYTHFCYRLYIENSVTNHSKIKLLSQLIYCS